MDHDQARVDRAGLGFAFGAYFAWGIAPLYFKAVKAVPPLEIGCHRAVWSMLVLLGLVLLRRRWADVGKMLKDRRKLLVCALTTVLISGNWLLFIWAIDVGRLLEASMGYFINPLVNVVLGLLFLKESLNRVQWISVGLAGIGVAILVVSHGTLPILSLTLAFSFGAYGLLRKRFEIDPMVGLLVETALLTPLAAGYLVWRAAAGTGSFVTAGVTLSLLLAVSGVITAFPLLWFTEGARRLKLSTLGLMQYVAPTGQFLLAVFAFGEPFTRTHALTFGFIWASLALYSGEAMLRLRQPAPHML